MILTVLICIVALWWYLRKPYYRMLMPSTMNFVVWGITSYLIYSSTKGSMSTGNISVSQFEEVIPFICGMMMSSFIGFNIAHQISTNRDAEVNAFNIDYIEWLLNRFKWLLYVVLITGIINLIYLIMVIGFNGLGDYRIAVLSVDRAPLIRIIRTIGGHAGILGFFYLALYGYKQAVRGVNIWQLIIYIIMYGMNNIAIAGRAWIAMSFVPYIIGFFIGHRSKKQDWSNIQHKDLKKLLVLGGILVVIFIVIGSMRKVNKSIDDDEGSPIEKLLYFTDGSRVSNIVMKMYPDGTFPLEYGQCEFLTNWIPSPMKTKYYSAISDNIGLTVTVTSTIPALYFDFGYMGGIIMWGIFCFFIELLFLNMINRDKILCFFVAVLLTRMMYQAPIGEIFGMSISTVEWLIILYVFRDKLFIMPESVKTDSMSDFDNEQ